MKKGLCISFLYLISSCTIDNTEIPANATITAMYNVHDEVNSPILSKCSDLKNDFLIAKKTDCTFTMAGYEFDIEEKYIFNEHGKFTEYWTYLSEGPLVYKIEDLRKDINYLTSIGGEHITVKWGNNKKTIITQKDTLKIEKIFPHYKLIWIERDKETKLKGRRIIIEYK